MNRVAKQQERLHFRMPLQPASEGSHFRHRAEALWLYILHFHRTRREQNKKMPQRRRSRSCDFQKIQGNGQRHFGKAPDVVPRHAEQKYWRDSLAIQIERIQLAIIGASEDEQNVRSSRTLRAGEPVFQERYRPAGWKWGSQGRVNNGQSLIAETGAGAKRNIDFHLHLATINVMSSAWRGALNCCTPSSTERTSSCEANLRCRRRASAKRCSPNSSPASLNDSVMPSV